jgi:release factor glutamine methyltransferase
VTAAGTIARGESIDAARRRLAHAFRRAGLDAPELDARLLVGHALGLGHTALVADGCRQLSADEAVTLAGLATRRLGHEPVARIVGHKEFWGLPLRLNADTLVPRPETETLIEAALSALGGRRREALRILDLGTGSGALLLALLTELPAAYGIGTDLSVAALACARGNAEALGLATRAAFVACDYAAALRGPFDLIVCNPPYVARGEIATLAPEVKDFDPARSLDGGADGLDGYRTLAAQAPRLLGREGRLIIELGAGQATAVAGLFAAADLSAAGEPQPDLSGVPRALVLQALP